MSTLSLFLATIAFFTLGCDEPPAETTRSSFAFSHEGIAYEIISIGEPSSDGRNFLLRRAGGQFVLRARDDDQDGQLDTLLSGELSLEEANGIYRAGLGEAQVRGKYREQLAERAAPSFSVLVFSKTAGYRHASIPDGIAALEALGAANDFTVEATEDASAFSDEGLAPYEVVVFLSTTQDVLDEPQQAAFERFIRAGGGFVGVHAASDTEYDWPWYGGLVGAYFDNHPEIQEATVVIEDQDHPATAHLPATWVRTDEWYNFKANPRSAVHVLATLDESTYEGGTMGDDHPLAWCHAYDGGRAWYTGMGHTSETYADPLFHAHLLGGLRYAAGLGGDCPVSEEEGGE